MNEVRIRRGGSGRLSTKAKPRASAQSRRKSPINTLLARIPVSHATIQRGLSWSIVVAVAAALIGTALFFGLPGMARMEIAELAAHAGYEVKHVEVTGTDHMDEQLVYAIALGEVDRSMLNVDLNALREKLLTLPWVKDARIARRLPDTLAVDIVERVPAAIWQHRGKLALIDASGAVLEAVDAQSMPELPLIVGEGANMQAERLTRLVDAAPALKPVLAGATWVGNRRWDLRFQSGETLSLPEGDSAAAAALVNFARMDGINRLLGRGIVRFDMRDPSKFVLRLPKGRTADKPDLVTPAMQEPEDAKPAQPAEAGNSSAPAKLAKKEQG